VIPASLPTGRLPRARTLTDALLAPSDPPPTGDQLASLGRRLQEDLASLALPPGARRIRVDPYLLRTVHPTAELPGDGAPFRWSPRTARRAIGVAAVAACVDGSVRTPAEAVVTRVAQLVEDTRQGLARAGSLAEWLALTAGGALAAVVAEATTWATRLFGAVEWTRLDGPPSIGGPDRWWDCPGAPLVGLRGRADVRIPPVVGREPRHRSVATDVDPTDGSRRSGPSVLSMVGGRPGPTSRLELGLAALVDVLSRPSAAAPGRVVGWWPDCGRALVLGVDLHLLRQTADAVVTAVGTAAGTGH
jgi:hypothetical protein